MVINKEHTMITAAEVGAEIYALLVEAVEAEFAGESEAAKQAAIARILGSVGSL